MSNSGQWINNVKQVIRVTLVGIDPSDQVQIKGYLRILLRVDFDIEWVSPKNPKVDLFIVNHAFSNSDSVKALISESRSPVLYVAHNENKSNVIENNTLYLKLEHVAVLETWLNQNVPRIYETYNADATAGNLLRTQINETALKNRVQSTPEATPAAFTSTPTPTRVQAQTENTRQVTNSKSEGLPTTALYLINTLNNTKDSRYYEVINRGTVVAVVKPDQRLIWPKGGSFFPDFSLNWELNQVDIADLEVKHAMNLNTWVWLCALEEETGSIKQVLPLDAKLSLKTWPKPKNSNNKSDYLRILAMTELMPLSVNDISQKTNIAIDKVHRCMAALYMAGFMETGLLTLDVYVKQMVAQSNLANTNTSQMALTTKDGRLLSSPDEVEKVVNQQIEEKLESNYMAKEPPSITKDKGFGGFLSRIRSTLGL